LAEKSTTRKGWSPPSDRKGLQLGQSNLSGSSVRQAVKIRGKRSICRAARRESIRAVTTSDGSRRSVNTGHLSPTGKNGWLWVISNALQTLQSRTSRGSYSAEFHPARVGKFTRTCPKVPLDETEGKNPSQRTKAIAEPFLRESCA